MGERIGIRVNLTLPPEVVATLDRISAVTNAGRASIIREFLIEGHHGLGDIAHALELAKQKNLDAFNVLAKSLDKTISQSEQMALEMRRTSRRMRRKKK